MDSINVNMLDEIIQVNLTENNVFALGEVNSVELDYVCGEIINSNRVVAISNNKIYKANNENIFHLGCVVGISKTSGIVNESIKVVKLGKITNSAWTLIPNLLCYFDSNGTITQSVPQVGFIQSVGVATTINEIDILISDLIIN